jgi:hypothetical protein
VPEIETLPAKAGAIVNAARRDSALSFASDLPYIAMMSSVVTVLLVLAMAAVVVVLVVGVFSMARGGEFNRRHSNRLMRLRVGFQALALVLFAVLVFLTEKG